MLVHGTRSDAEQIKAQIGSMLAEQLRMTLSPSKTHITHIDDGFVFLGFRIQRWPSRNAAGWCGPSRPRTRWPR